MSRRSRGRYTYALLAVDTAVVGLEGEVLLTSEAHTVRLGLIRVRVCREDDLLLLCGELRVRSREIRYKGEWEVAVR